MLLKEPNREHPLAEVPIIGASLLPRDIQVSLIAEIEQKTQAAQMEPFSKPKKPLLVFKPATPDLHDALYLVTQRTTYSPESINYPFAVTRSSRELTGLAYTDGPFPVRFLPVFAYVSQESVILQSQSTIDDRMKKFLDIQTSTRVIGSGMRRFVGQISLMAKTNPYLEIEENISIARQRTLSIIMNELEENRNRLSQAMSDGGDRGPWVSTYMDKLCRLQDEIKGFTQGQILLSELQRYPWKIQV